MKKIISSFAFLIVILAGCSSQEVASDSENNGTIYFIPIVETGTYWSGIIEGASSTAADLGYSFEMRTTPPSEVDKTTKHLGFIDEAIADPNTAGIAFAAQDKTAYDRKLQEAMDAGIPVVTFDGDTESESAKNAFIGTNNYEAGVVLGTQGATFLKEQAITSGTVATVTTNITQTTMLDRSKGIKDGFAEVMGSDAANFKWTEPVVDNDQMAVSKTGLESQIVANDDMVAVFSLGSEGPDSGTMEAIKSQGKQNEIFHFGFDFTPTWGNGIEDNLITGIVDQDSKMIGQKTIEVIDMLVSGESVDATYPVDALWYDQESLKLKLAE